MPSHNGYERGSVSIDVDYCRTVSADTDVEVDDILSVSFSEDVEIIIKERNTVLPFPYELPKGVWLDFNNSTTEIQVNVDCNMFAMGR